MVSTSPQRLSSGSSKESQVLTMMKISLWVNQPRSFSKPFFRERLNSNLFMMMILKKIWIRWLLRFQTCPLLMARIKVVDQQILGRVLRLLLLEIRSTMIDCSWWLTMIFVTTWIIWSRREIILRFCPSPVCLSLKKMKSDGTRFSRPCNWSNKQQRLSVTFFKDSLSLLSSTLMKSPMVQKLEVYNLILKQYSKRN